MKKLFSLLCTVCLVLSATACGRAEPSPAEAAPAQVDGPTLEADYLRLLRRSKDMPDRGGEYTEDYLLGGLPWIFFLCAPGSPDADSIGYAVTDINGDGLPELLIAPAGHEPDGYFWGLFAYCGGAIRPVVLSGERAHCHLRQGGVIKYSGSSSAWEYEEFYYTLTEDGVRFEDGYFTVKDEQAPDQVAFFRSADGTRENARPATREEAEAVGAAYAPMPSDYAPVAGLTGGEGEPICPLRDEPILGYRWN